MWGRNGTFGCEACPKGSPFANTAHGRYRPWVTGTAKALHGSPWRAFSLLKSFFDKLSGFDRHTLPDLRYPEKSTLIA